MTDKDWIAEKEYYSHMASGIAGKSIVVLNAEGEELGYTSKGNQIHIAKEHPMYINLDQKGATALRFGVAVHEALHQVFTNFDYIQTMEKKLIKKRILKTELDAAAYHTIVNLIEDPAIENMAADLIGGPALRALDFTIKTIYDLSGEISEGCRYPFDEVVNALIQFGDLGIVKGTFRYQAAEIVFRHITPMFYQAINEPDCAKRVEMASPIFAECARLWAGRTNQEQKSMLESHKKNAAAHGKNFQSHGAEGSGSNGTMHENTEKNERRKTGMQKKQDTPSPKGESGEKNQGTKVKNSLTNSQPNGRKNQETIQADDTSKSDHMPSEEDQEPEKSDAKNGKKEKSHSNSSETEQEISKKEKNTVSSLTEEDIESILDRILEYRYQEELKGRENQEYYRPFDEFDEINNHPAFKDVKVENRYVNQVSTILGQQYDRLVDGMQPGISVVTQQLKEIFIADRIYKVYSESGRASMKRFASGKVTTRLFERRRKPGHKEDMCVAIIGDCSGSMSGDKNFQEKLAVIALAEIFAEFDIPFYFMGFHVPNVPIQSHYIRWDNTREERERLMLLECSGTNFDSYSIRYAANLLKERPERHKLLIVLSDGLPSYYFSGEEGIRQNTLAVNEARENHIDVIGIGIGNVKSNIFCKMYQKEYFLNVKQPNDLFEMLAERITTVVNGWE